MRPNPCLPQPQPGSHHQAASKRQPHVLLQVGDQEADIRPCEFGRVSNGPLPTFRYTAHGGKHASAAATASLIPRVAVWQACRVPSPLSEAAVRLLFRRLEIRQGTVATSHSPKEGEAERNMDSSPSAATAKHGAHRS
ncbi:hypothetical protein VTI28DRAFT_7100 [Corynascus sepedonium]